MNWALQIRGFKPGVWKVLVHLSDRHNTDLRYCYPDQELLAAECEVSRATLNRHLAELEEAGLIKRVPQRDPVSRLQLNTRYYLAFDTDLSTLDVVGRVSNCDTEIRVSKSAKSVSHSSETPITSKITSNKPLTPSRVEPGSPPDVGAQVHIHAILDHDLFEACCRICGHNRSALDKRGGWFFGRSVIDQAKAELAGRLP